MKNYLSTKESAALLRKALRAELPGTKFSVRMSRGSAYGNVHVEWTGGPSVDEVEAITGPFEGASFDGMQDLMEYQSRPISVDENGEPQLSGLNLILHHRNREQEVA